MPPDPRQRDLAVVIDILGAARRIERFLEGVDLEEVWRTATGEVAEVALRIAAVREALE